MATTKHYHGIVTLLGNDGTNKEVSLSISEHAHGLLIKIANDLYTSSEEDVTVFAPSKEAKKIAEAAGEATNLYKNCRSKTGR